MFLISAYIGSYGAISICMAVVWGIFWAWQGINQLIGKQVYREHAAVPDRLLNAGALLCSLVLVAAPIWVRYGLWPVAPASVAVGCVVTIILLLLAIRVSAVLAAGLTPQVVGQKANDIVAIGPYAMVRHPIYLLTALAAWATALTFGRSVALAAAAGMSLCYYGLAIREERKLAKRNKQLFGMYRSRVPMLVPRLRPAHVHRPEGQSAPVSSRVLFEKKPAQRARAGRKG